MLISVITPVYRGQADWLDQAYQSLRDQDLPAEWEWEWLVQADGENEQLPLPAEALADIRVKTASGPKGGPAIARNLALARSTGSLIAVLDADDVLTPGALARSIEILTRYPDIGWTACRALDLMPDGTLVSHLSEPGQGLLSRGQIFSRWYDAYYELPVHPATICIRREWLLAVGGWMAMPAAEDAGMLLAVQAMVPGWYIPEVGLHYRKHPDQITNSLTKETRRERLEILAERVWAIQALMEPPISRLSEAERRGGSSGFY